MFQTIVNTSFVLSDLEREYRDTPVERRYIYLPLPVESDQVSNEDEQYEEHAAEPVNLGQDHFEGHVDPIPEIPTQSPPLRGERERSYSDMSSRIDDCLSEIRCMNSRISTVETSLVDIKSDIRGIFSMLQTICEVSL